ncbi:hypothetical protein KY362_03955 [Candidatus Woesearchaeota archaeon]|nr:hypothetical protein [Candidatus Woesearchaeota archaeon]
MRWVRHYRLKSSKAHNIMKTIKRREKMGKRKSEHKAAHEAKERVLEVHDKEVAPDKQFVLCNGERISSIHQLSLMIDKLSDEVFSHHVNAEKNDFAAWINDVFQEHELASELSAKTCRKENQIALLKHVVTKK